MNKHKAVESFILDQNVEEQEKSLQSNWLQMPIIALVTFHLKYNIEAAMNLLKWVSSLTSKCKFLQYE